jgi:hypothetical protein
MMLREGEEVCNKGMPLSELQLLAPVPFQVLVVMVAFRQHVAAARKIVK